ncbi:hypothetical protein RIF29_19487 [Crotalaria pallida]|uniref:Small ribosomal subunit protein bS18c n=1 Tax=Crotalaria pallida TaxID=3830 RepID=A0AAN9I7S1_CROPI
MKIVSVALRSLNRGLSNRFHQTHLRRSLSSWMFSDNGSHNQQTNKSESHEEFQKQIFGETPRSESKIDAFFDKLGRTGRTYGSSNSVYGGSLHDLEDGFDTLSDGMDGNLKNAATYFEFDPEETMKEDYAYRYDTSFFPGSTYSIKDLDLTKPAAQKPPIRPEFTVTTKEVLSQADFRNVRFLANFITEAGILIKRSKTGISAKAQRKVAREIKTARAFGLMPFTTMGTKSFVYGVTMESLDKDYAYASIDRNMHDEPDM